MSTLRISLFIGAVTLMLTGIGQAEMITADAADGSIGDDGSINNGGGKNARTGTLNGTDQAVTLPFDLPDVNPDNITGASFSINLNATRMGPQWDIDLFGLARTASEPTLLLADYYAGDPSDDTTNTLLEESLLVDFPAPDSGLKTSSGAALLAFIKDQYAAFGAGHDFSGEDDFIFLRLNSDDSDYPGNNASNNGYIFAMSEAPDEDGNPAPTLTLDVIPEPASMALLGLGGLALLRRRWT